jgi:hypothetical protein
MALINGQYPERCRSPGAGTASPGGTGGKDLDKKEIGNILNYSKP